MKVLLDTNLLIRLEPTSIGDVEEGIGVAVELMNVLNKGGHQTFIHPESLRELAGDKNEDRRAMRAVLMGKYPQLPAPPVTGTSVTDELGIPRPDSHDVVDFALIAATKADAVDFLVSDDQKLLRRAARVGLLRRALSPVDALATLRALDPVPPRPLPSVVFGFAHELDSADPIFASLRADYEGFDDWLTACKRKQRRVWTIREEGALAALALIKHEDAPEYGLSGPLLKLCTFKVAARFRGFRYGELLLKAVFEYAFSNGFRTLYVTVFEKHESLVSLFDAFGFEPILQRSKHGEAVMVKPLIPTAEDRENCDSLGFHVRFGPQHLVVSDVFVIPIQSQFHRKLFPELQKQASLFEQNEVYGNSILKAYLCKAKSRGVRAGATILFYHSGGTKCVDAVGIVEDVLASKDPVAIARFVGKRTVYSIREIEEMCGTGEVLAILFRQAFAPTEPIPIRTLMAEGVLKSHPQSVVSVQQKGTEWTRRQLEPRY